MKQTQTAQITQKIDQVSLPRTIHLVPLNNIAGFDVRPGFYEINGATAIPGGVNFTVHSKGAVSVELLLFHRTENEPFAVLPFPPHYRIGNVYSMIVFKLNIEEFEYAYRVDGPYDPEKGLIFDKSKYLLDPYAKAVTGQSQWGKKSPHGQHYKARVVKDDFDWEDMHPPLIPMEDLIIYELHVRGFTRHESSGVAYPGTFAGLMEKLDYLEDLGVNVAGLSEHKSCDDAEMTMLTVKEICRKYGVTLPELLQNAGDCVVNRRTIAAAHLRSVVNKALKNLRKKYPDSSGRKKIYISETVNPKNADARVELVKAVYRRGWGYTFNLSECDCIVSDGRYSAAEKEFLKSSPQVERASFAELGSKLKICVKSF